jgi:hypothetical protein
MKAAAEAAAKDRAAKRKKLTIVIRQTSIGPAEHTFEL